MPKGGRLIFKGGEAAVSSRGKKKEKIKRKREKALALAEAEGDLGKSETAGATSGGNSEGGADTGVEEEEMRPISGTGRITSSSTAVHGHGTKFMDELHAGDAIIITHPTTLREETRIIKILLSNISIGISSPFGSDLITTTKFRYIKAPRVEKTAEARVHEAKRRKIQEEDGATGTYGGSGGKRFVYRERTAQGNYRIVEETMDEAMSREQLLDLRAKKKADRHCS